MPQYAPPRALIVALTATLLFSAATVQAADKKKISPAERKLAQRHFELASTYYQQAAYDEALRYFDKSYQLSGEPALLFNIGKCHEALGQLKKAIVSYKAYLKASGANPTVEARIRNLSSRLPKKKAPQKAVTPAKPPADKPDEPPPSKAAAAPSGPAKDTRPAATPTPRAAPAAGSTSDGGGRTWSWWTGWVGLGVGVAAVGASIAFGVLAKNKADTVESYYRDGNRDWSEVQSIEDQGKSFQTAQIVTLAAGIGLAAAGAALLLFLPRRSSESSGGDSASRRERSNISLAPVLGGGVYGVAGALRF